MSKQPIQLSNDLLSNINYDRLEMAQNIAQSLKMPASGLGTAAQTSQYGNDIKILAVAVFSITGVIKRTAEIIGVVYHTVTRWQNKEWWHVLEQQIAQLNVDIFNARTNKIINMAFDSVEKRLENGDFANYDDKGVMRLRPVSGKDSAIIAGVMFDKQRINNALCNNITQVTHTHLIDIKGQFDTMSQQRVIQGEVE